MTKRVGMFAAWLLCLPLLCSCGHKSHAAASDQTAPPSGDGPGQQPGPAVTLAETPLRITMPDHQWVLNSVSADDGFPAAVTETFAFAPDQGGFLEFGYEEKDLHDCAASAVFTYDLTIRDLADNGADADHALVLKDCIAYPAGHTFRLTAKLVNTGGCEGLALSFGLLARASCSAD